MPLLASRVFPWLLDPVSVITLALVGIGNKVYAVFDRSATICYPIDTAAVLSLEEQMSNHSLWSASSYVPWWLPVTSPGFLSLVITLGLVGIRKKVYTVFNRSATLFDRSATRADSVPPSEWHVVATDGLMW